MSAVVDIFYIFVDLFKDFFDIYQGIKSFQRRALRKLIDNILSEKFLEGWNNEEDTARAANLQVLVKETLEKDGLYKAADLALRELDKFNKQDRTETQDG